VGSDENPRFPSHIIKNPPTEHPLLDELPAVFERLFRDRGPSYYAAFSEVLGRPSDHWFTVDALVDLSAGAPTTAIARIFAFLCLPATFSVLSHWYPRARSYRPTNLQMLLVLAHLLLRSRDVSCLALQRLS